MGVSRTVLPITTVAAWPGWNFGGMKLRNDWFWNVTSKTIHSQEHPPMSKQVQNSNLQIQKPILSPFIPCIIYFPPRIASNPTQSATTWKTMKAKYAGGRWTAWSSSKLKSKGNYYLLFTGIIDSVFNILYYIYIVLVSEYCIENHSTL